MGNIFQLTYLSFKMDFKILTILGISWTLPLEWFVPPPKGHYLTLHICAQWLEALRTEHTKHTTRGAQVGMSPGNLWSFSGPRHCRRSQPHWENWRRPQERTWYCIAPMPSAKKLVNVPFCGHFRCFFWTILRIIRCSKFESDIHGFLFFLFFCYLSMPGHELKRIAQAFLFFFVTFCVCDMQPMHWHCRCSGVVLRARCRQSLRYRVHDWG